MKKSMQRYITTGNASSRLGRLKVIKNNCAALYYWQPGYTLHEQIKASDGKVIEKKKFRPTSTIEMAVSFLTKYYGPEEFLKHKGDVHPGHVSLAVKDTYLSIGTNDDLRNVTLRSHHNLVFTNSLIQEIQGFERIPDCVDLHTLDTDKMTRFIDEFKKSPTLYSLLGKRFNLAGGESCATIVHECLLQGNFSQLIDFIPTQLLSERTILTPTALKDYCEIARAMEHSLSPAIVKLSAEFQKCFKHDMESFEVAQKQGQEKADSEISRPSSTKS
jgi:hypothetical protein